MFSGEIQAEGGQDIEHGKFAHVTTVIGFHPDDAHHHLGGDAIGLLGASQCSGVFTPKLHAGFDATRFDEAIPISHPVFGGGCGRRQNELTHLAQDMRLGELFLSPLHRQAVALRQSLGQLLHFRGMAPSGLGLARCGPTVGGICVCQHGAQAQCQAGDGDAQKNVCDHPTQAVGPFAGI